MDKKKRVKAYSQRTLFIFASLTILSVGVWMVFSETWGQIQELFSYRININQAKAELMAQEERMAKAQKIFDEFHNQVEMRKEFSLSLPLRTTYNQVLAEAEAMASITSVTLESENFQEKTVINRLSKSSHRIKSPRTGILRPYSVILLDVQGSGTYSQIKNFVKLIESDIRLMSVESIEISQGNSSESNGFNPRLSFQATIAFYRQEAE